MLNELLSAVYRRFPSHDIVGYFRATLPLHRLHITAQVLERQALPLIPQFVLRAIQIGHDTTAALADVLGLDHPILFDAAGQLLHGDLIEERPVAGGGPAKLTLRPAGEELLATKGAMSVTMRRDYTFHFNPVTATLEPVDSGAVTTLAPEYEDDAILPRQVFTPTIASLTVDMARAARGEEDRHRRDIIDLLEIQTRNSYPEYLPRVDVFLLRASDGDEAVAAFHKTHHLPEVSSALTAMHHSDVRVVPDDACLFDRNASDVHELLPEATAQFVKDIFGQNRTIAAYERSMAMKRAARGTTESREEQGQLDAEITRVNDRLQAARGDRDRALETLQGSLDAPARLVEASEQAVTLGKMIAAANHDLLLVAPWISGRALGDARYKELGNAARRVERLALGYDVGRKRGSDQGRLEEQARRLRQRIAEQARWDPDKPATADNVAASVHIVDITYAGPTVVICDDNRALITPCDLFVVDPSARILPAPTGILFEDTVSVIALTKGMERILGTGRAE